MNSINFTYKHVLFFCVLAYLFSGFTVFFASEYPGGVDTTNHLFQVWFIKEYGLRPWNSFWYAGTPMMDQYPPLTHIIPAILSSFMDVVLAYKIVFLIGFAALPVCFHFFIKEFNLRGDEKSLSLLLFSFAVAYTHYYHGNVYSSLLSMNFAILYFKFLKRLVDFGGYRNIILCAVFLSLCSFSHAINPGFSLIFSIPFILVYSYKRIKEFVSVVVATGLLSSWFWVPYFLNYGAPKATRPDLDFISLILELVLAVGRAYVVFVNYVGLFFLAVFFIVIFYSFANNLLKKKDVKYTWFLVALLATVVVIVVIPLSALADIRRMILFFPVFLAPFIAKSVCALKKKEAVSAALLLPLLILFFTYPNRGADINAEVFELIDYINASSARRVVVVPEYYDVMTQNKSYMPVEETLYSTYLVPAMTGREVLNGWWPLGLRLIQKPDEYNYIAGFGCEGYKDYRQLISEASWINQNTISTRKNCDALLDSRRYCEWITYASLDFIVVNKYFPEVTSFIEGLGCTKKIKEFNKFSVYEVAGKKPYISSNLSSVDFTYSKKPGEIRIYFSLNKEEDLMVSVAENYGKYWRAYLDGLEVAVERSPLSFIDLSFPASAGRHELLLVYSPPDYGNIFLYTSLLSWLIALFLVFYLSREGS